jgi:hypothetical protein
MDRRAGKMVRAILSSWVLTLFSLGLERAIKGPTRTLEDSEAIGTIGRNIQRSDAADGRSLID